MCTAIKKKKNWIQAHSLQNLIRSQLAQSIMVSPECTARIIIPSVFVKFNFPSSQIMKTIIIWFIHTHEHSCWLLMPLLLLLLLPQLDTAIFFPRLYFIFFIKLSTFYHRSSFALVQHAIEMHVPMPRRRPRQASTSGNAKWNIL